MGLLFSKHTYSPSQSTMCELYTGLLGFMNWFLDGCILIEAARNGNEKVVKMLLEKEGTQVTKNGNIALLWAAYRGHHNVVEILLQNEEIQLNYADVQEGRTPLYYAAQC